MSGIIVLTNSITEEKMDTYEIELQAQEANSGEYEEFLQAVSEIETNPVDTLRQWYIEKGEWEEVKIELPEFFVNYISIP